MKSPWHCVAYVGVGRAGGFVKWPFGALFGLRFCVWQAGGGRWTFVVETLQASASLAPLVLLLTAGSREPWKWKGHMLSCETVQQGRAAESFVLLSGHLWEKRGEAGIRLWQGCGDHHRGASHVLSSSQKGQQQWWTGDLSEAWIIHSFICFTLTALGWSLKSCRGVRPRLVLRISRCSEKSRPVSKSQQHSDRS